MSRLLGLALVLGALIFPSEALGVPVDPAPVSSPTFDGAVHTVAYSGNVIFVGGEFTHATTRGTRVRRDRLAAIDATTGTLLDWAPSVDAPVTELVADPSGVYIAGLFAMVNQQSRDSLAKLDPRTGALLPGLRHEIYGRPHALALGHGRLFLGGSFTSVDGVSRAHLAAFDVATGALDQSWAPKASGPVFDLLAASDRVYLAGRFDDVNGVPRTQKLAAVDPGTAVVDRSFTSRVHAFVTSLFLAGDTVYAGIDGGGGRASAMDLDGDLKWTVTLDGDVQAVAVLDDTVYLGGHFDNVCKTHRLGSVGSNGTQCVDGFDRRVKLVAVDLEGKLLPWTANANGTIGVRTLASSADLGQVVAAGYFETLNGSSQPRFALFRLPGDP